MRVQESVRVLVSEGDRVVVSDLWKVEREVDGSDLGLSSEVREQQQDLPCELRSSSLPMSVSWKAALMKVSPVPE